MKKFSGLLSKMTATLDNSSLVSYQLNLSGDILPMNILLDQEINLNFSGNIYCIKCGRKINKSFQQGYCYPCFISVPETEECILRPELCRAHEGIARDMEFATNHCLTNHFVYLAITGDIKVGVTRHTQIPARWIDQGAAYAVKIARTPNRFLAGTIEVALKQLYSDKTNWRSLLRKDAAPADLIFEKGRAEEALTMELREYILNDEEVVKLNYPILSYPEKIVALDPAKNKSYSGILKGIKGQYLIFQDGKVINLRKFTGYQMEISVN